MRRAWLLVLACNIAGACSSFTGDDVAPDASSDDDASTDVADTSSTEADGPLTDAGCVPETRTLRVFRSAILDSLREDASANRFCDLAAAVCLLEFEVVDAGATVPTVVTAKLVVPRASGNDCNAPDACAAAPHNAGATVTGAAMRTDWTASASYKTPWETPGAQGPMDESTIHVQAMVPASAPADLAFAGPALDSKFAATTANPYLAFRLSADSTNQPFVIRRSEYADAARPDLATLEIQFCK